MQKHPSAKTAVPKHPLSRFLVVTGGTDGIGRCYIDELANTRGVRKFYLLGRNPAKLEKVKKELVEKFNCEVKTSVFDFEKDDVETLPEELKTLDVGILINCAGIGPAQVADFSELPNNLPTSIYKVNLLTPTKMIELILPGMIKRDLGIVVNVSSMTCWRPLPYMSTYPASKAAVSFFSDTLAYELHGKSKVRIQCLVPLLVATKIASYDTDEANDIWVIDPRTYAKQAVHLIGQWSLAPGCFLHDVQVALGTLIGFPLFRAVFVPLVMLGVHKQRVAAYQAKKSS
uniref:Estradiol 17-beta-dehydrogenase 12 n=1 Tax=Steinernema glaseri TaxID=37863 RepID=A0A1I7YYS1_9BILA